MTDAATPEKEIWENLIKQLRGLGGVFGPEKMDEIIRAVESVQDMTHYLMYFQKSETYRIMYLFMIARQGRRIQELETKVRELLQLLDNM